MVYKGQVGRDYTQIISRGEGGAGGGEGGAGGGRGTLHVLCNVFSRSALKCLQLIFTKIVRTNKCTETSHILLCWYIHVGHRHKC